MTRDPTLLADTRTAVARWTEWRVGAFKRDPHGAIGFLAYHDDHRLLCTCKRSLHAGLASFMHKLVRIARGEGYVLVEFVGETPTPGSAYAFDPETVYHIGQDSTGESAKGVETEWLELPADEFGVLLGDFVSGRRQLIPAQPTPSGQMTLGVN